jgi:hypothetical protein|tara:strand:- start:328 stop:429 length:102 start_codon:yes stop_codon:yes gene_type:complete
MDKKTAIASAISIVLNNAKKKVDAKTKREALII